MILCEEGQIASYGTRGGRAEIQRKGKDKEGHEALVEMASDFELEPLAAHFFPDCIGAENVDWRLIALEYFELGEAILHGRQVELDGLEGLKDVAAVYAILESSLAGRSVSMQEIEACKVYGYQQEIDEALGIPG
jgi:hypothetical protein